LETPHLTELIALSPASKGDEGVQPDEAVLTWRRKRLGTLPTARSGVDPLIQNLVAYWLAAIPQR
jgi:hypothetical protein